MTLGWKAHPLHLPSSFLTSCLSDLSFLSFPVLPFFFCCSFLLRARRRRADIRLASISSADTVPISC